ncbi:pilus assembly protein PilM [Candidatus Saccharibacteria bacterium RIFCSPHIGHO2_01_FULL_45_15]|nr:MAG: pilus assembly protein PilM [Candidatus Saccharibacteria bacterium RIFCSPHIGHO2_01_FULL_45_15]OGL32653.1 MAG: pilus assembly protein PilM [Candidatus Saccharibacteria bacterium RIFCSPHIGHO2_12_FULL_44_22]
MAIIKGVGDFFGLDIGTTAIRVVQLTATGPDKWSLKHYGYAPIDIKTATADSSEARRRLGEVIMTVVGQSGIKTKNVAIGLPSNKTFITVVDMPLLSEAELKGTIKYQIDQYIPMSLDDAKVDWAVLGQSLHDPSQQEVLLASTAASYSEERLELVESLGFDVIAAEPDSLAMIRSLIVPGQSDAQVVIDIGELSTNVAIAYNDMPRLVRTIPNGLSTLVRAAVQNLSIEDEQARQFILKFGLAPDKLEGQVAHALESTLDGFASEITKSIKFFQTRYPSISIGTTLLSGYASIVPGLSEYLGAKTGIHSVAGDPWKKVAVPSGDQKLQSLTSEMAIAIGLAQRSNKK